MKWTHVRLTDSGVVLRRWRSTDFDVRYDDILTAERLRSRRGLALHVRGSSEPHRVKCRRAELASVESGLRYAGVRIVDCWGAIIAPTLLDFEEELACEPTRVRQSSDNA